MARLLTLAMSEMSPKNRQYKVIAYYIEQGEIIGIDLLENRFKDVNGAVVWDIGAVTRVESIIRKDEGLYEIKGDMVLEKYYSKNQLKDVFLSELTNYLTFKRNTCVQYAVVKASTVIMEKPELDKNNCFRTYITFWANGEEGKSKYNKDYRWLNYWKHIYNESNKKAEERMNKYEKFFQSKEIYLILFRYKGQGKSNNNSIQSRKYNYTKEIHWIAGFHYF